MFFVHFAWYGFRFVGGFFTPYGYIVCSMFVNGDFIFCILVWLHLAGFVDIGLCTLVNCKVVSDRMAGAISGACDVYCC